MNTTPLICIVDDHEEIRQAFADYLAKEEYQFLLLESGEQLLSYNHERLPDVILLDVMMPGSSGFTVCTQLKAQPLWQPIPIILITALNDQKHMIQGLEAGAEEYLTKPINSVELRARVRSMLRLKQQYDALQAGMLLREKLAHMVVHDMRQPIGAALMRTFLLAKRAQLTESDQQDLQIIQSQLRHLNSFANEILLVAKMENNQLVLSLEPIDLKELIQQLRRDYEIQAKFVNITLVVDLPDESRSCQIDKNLIVRVLDNLVSNALKFAPPNSELLIKLTYPAAAEQQACIQVIDMGTGIPEEYAQSIFEPYKILEMREARGPQTGLGLAFCKMAVEAHQGSISVSQNHPQGTIFTIML